MSYLYTGSTNESSISTGLSTQIIIQVNGVNVGAIQSFRPSQSRSIGKVGEIGTDGFIEKVPSRQTDIKISVTRIVFDRLSLPAAFARQFVNIAAQRVPFDILVFDRSNVHSTAGDGDVGNDRAGLVTHIYKNCWFASLNTAYKADDYIITEDAEIECEYVNSFQDTGSSSTSVVDGNSRAGFSADTSGGNIERLADFGNHRGSLDAVGLARLLQI